MITIRARLEGVGSVTVTVDEETGDLHTGSTLLDVELFDFVDAGGELAGTPTGPFYERTLRGGPEAVKATVCAGLEHAGWEIRSVDPPVEPVGRPGAVY